ncbi:MAG: spore coat protein CotJB, partial [Clostridia bacterium]|nr:spore coat protein CotJB [Clostridia bacterium]
TSARGTASNTTITERIGTTVTKTDNKSRRKLMRDIQIASFSAIETALYLDTHPYDREAIKALSAYCAEKEAATAR